MQNIEQIIIDTIIKIKTINIKTNSEGDNHYNILKNLVKQETDTLEYQLRVLSYNYIGDRPFNIINESTEDILDNYRLILPDVKPRLIMVFGPSASGKTSSSGEMIKMFSKSYPDFPTCFMTLDGGKFRKASKIFQMIIHQAAIHDVDIASHNIFPKVKHTIMKYYENQVAKYNTMISLYIPITLGKSYIQSYSTYVELTKDTNWIGVFIWQHKFDCIYEGKYKCNGCAKSGIEREKIEGKKYKLYKWEASMERGLNEVKKAKGGFYCIHNGGRLDSLITMNDIQPYEFKIL